ncbi:MAG: hypothetical protein E6959_05450, partial [Eikenella corrodens]|nr:hypothetical protein [Eikenella corrodens]
DQFVLNGLAEATFSHRNILINFEYSWLSRTAPIFIIGAHHSMGDWFGFNLSRAEPNFDIFIHDAANPATYAEEAEWRRFEDWIIRCVESEGEDTL